LAEWLYEEGIGENRAILVEQGTIVEAAIELPGLRAGAIVAARLTDKGGAAMLDDGTQAIVAPPPAGLTEGAAFRAEVLREAIPERGRPKPAKVRATDLALRDGPSLGERIGNPSPLALHGPDRFEEVGWSELLEQAASGEIGFEGGALRMSVTPAMTLFDVDGGLPPWPRPARRRRPARSCASGLPARSASTCRRCRATGVRPRPRSWTESCGSRSSAPRSTASACSRSSAGARGRASPRRSRPIRPAPRRALCCAAPSAMPGRSRSTPRRQ
jgi:hypothetical protein